MQGIYFLKWNTQKENILIKHNVLKRIFDIFFSLFVLILGSPLFFIIALLVYFSSYGPIFYPHIRIGRGNKKIKCWKFRTMEKDADKKLNNLLKKDPLKLKEWQKYYKLKKDPRITSIGKFLRKTSLDELPQFYNVLKGDMSIVGPRPCVSIELTENFGKNTSKILSIRPGITGVWQVSGRNNIKRIQRVKLEQSYIDKQSFLLDAKIILKTMIKMFSSKGAY